MKVDLSIKMLVDVPGVDDPSAARNIARNINWQEVQKGYQDGFPSISYDVYIERTAIVLATPLTEDSK